MSLMNFTEPSVMAQLTPPGWLLDGGMAFMTEPQASVFPSFEAMHWTVLGGMKWLYAHQIRQEPGLPPIQWRPLPGPSPEPFGTALPGMALQAATKASAVATPFTPWSRLLARAMVQP